MPDLRIGATVDVSQVNAGMASAAQSTEQACQRIGISFQQISTVGGAALRKISDESKQAAQSVSVGSLQAAADTKELKLAQDDLRNALKLRNSEMLSAVEVDALIAASQERISTVTARMASRLGDVAVASHAAVTDVQATSAAVRSFEGNPGIRALEVFLGKTLGLGPLIKNLFPLIGTYAFIKVLFDVGEKIVDVTEKAREAGKVTAQAVEDQHEKYQVTLDDLALTNQRLQDQIDKVSGHPNNGLFTALLDAKKMADSLLESLKQDRTEIAGIFDEHSIGAMGSIWSGMFGKQAMSSGTQAEQLLSDYDAFKGKVKRINDQYDAELAGAKTAEAIMAAGKKRADAIKAAGDTEIAMANRVKGDLEKQEQDSLKPRMVATRNGLIRDQGDGIDNSKKKGDLDAYRQAIEKTVAAAQLGDSINDKQLTLGQVKQDKAGESGANKAAEIRLRNMEDERMQEEQDGKESAKDDYEFWIARINAFAKGSAEYHTIQEKITHDTIAIRKAGHDQIKKFEEEQKREAERDPAEREAADKAVRDLKKSFAELAEYLDMSSSKWDGYWNAVRKGDEIAAEQKQAMALLNVQAREASGELSPLAAAHEIAGIRAEEHKRKLQLLNDELTRSTKELKDLQAQNQHDPAVAKEMPRAKEKAQNAQNALDQEIGAGKLQAKSDTKALADQIAQPYLTAFQAVNQSWMVLQNDLISGNRRFGQDARQQAARLTEELAQHEEQRLAKFVQAEIRKAATHKATVMTGAADDQAGEAVSVQASLFAALKKQEHAAANAAGKAWSAMADIPIVGPVLGAAAAAATFAGVMALAAFEKGGVVGGSMGMAVPIIAHAGERVLTTSQTNTFERMVNGSGGGSTTQPVTINMGDNTFHGGGHGDVISALQKQGPALAKVIKRLHRDGHLRLS